MIVLLISIFGIAWLSCLGGIIFSDLWEWFLVPVLNIRNISIPEAMGIFLMAKFASMHLKEKDFKTAKEDELGHWEKIGLIMAVTFVYLTSWGIGYLITLAL